MYVDDPTALRQALDDDRLRLTGRKASQLIADVATILEESMGGTSGARTFSFTLVFLFTKMFVSFTSVIVRISHLHDAPFLKYLKPHPYYS
jgi:hypothetical protein